MPDDDTEIKQPDWDNPPCPACFAFDVRPEHVTSTAEEATEHLRMAYTSGLVQGFLMSRTRSTTFEHLCEKHQATGAAIIDAFCADFEIAREKVYEDIGIPIPGENQKH